MKNVKVLLISPGSNLVSPKAAKPKFHTHPLGLLYIASVLAREGCEVEIYDAFSFGYNIEQVKTRITAFQPDVIGISAMTIFAPAAYFLAAEAKKTNPSVITVMGGSHATSLPEEALTEGGMDVVILGEGEYSMLDVCRVVSEGGSDFSTVRGICFKQDGEIKRTQPRVPLENINDIPFPAYHLLPRMKEYNPPPHWGRKGKFASIVTSRGCPYGCIFCSVSRVWGKKYRYRTAKNVLAELLLLNEKYGASYFSFRDSTFTLHKRRVVDTCKAIIENGLRIKWNCNSRANEVDKTVLKWMRKAGCQSIQYGIECGNEDMLKRFKNLTRENITKAIDLTAKAGIKPHGYFILGLPGETKETIRETIDFAKSLSLYSAGFTTITPFPGSEIWDYSIENDLIITRDWSRYDLKNEPVVKHPNFTPAEILQSQKRAFKEFYLRPGIVLHHLSRIKSLNDLLNYAREALINFK